MSIAAMPRFRLAALPTPIQEATRLRDALGGATRCPRIVIKRDDLTGLAFGGNKVRKLEFLVADALAQGATTLITAGAAQSNHARATAAAARVAGLDAVLVLSAEGQPPVQGNLLIDALLDADVRLVGKETDEQAAMAAIADELKARGKRPYVIPVGGSNPVGALGYVAFTLELMGQLYEAGIEPSLLYHGNGSRGTQGGLAIGARIFSAPYRVQGIGVGIVDEAARAERAAAIANGAAELAGSSIRMTASDFFNDPGYVGAAYGAPTPGCDEAILLLARTEGVLLDPVYSGKAMAGLIDHIRSGRIAPDETVIFLHTGGQPALFAHAERLATVAKG